MLSLSRTGVVIAPHLNTNHYHNHFVLCSTSFIDGKRFHACKKSYQTMREASDRLCREYALSVIENPQYGKSKHYAEWQAEREGKPTWRGIIKKDMDEAIAQAMTDKQFFFFLRQKGYAIKMGKDISVRPPGKERFFRLARNFGEDYTFEGICRRILARASRPKPPVPPIPQKQTMKTFHFKGDLKKAKKIGGLRGLYLHYCYKLGILPKNRPSPARLHFLLREDLGKLDAITKETRLLCKYHIDTMEQLLSYKAGLVSEIDTLIEDRKHLRYQSRSIKDKVRLSEVKTEISAISTRLSELRREVKSCDNRKTDLVLCIAGVVPVIWLALLTAPYVSGGLTTIITGLTEALNQPLQLSWTEDSLKTVLLFLCAYGMGIGIYLSTRHNYRRGVEHGSARWGDSAAVCKKYRDKSFTDNKILTQNVRIGLDGRKHRSNLNIMVVGGSGAGKTRFYAKPNVMQANTSMVILDPKGEIARDTGYLLEQKGYEVRILDLINMERSHCYNPFVYLNNDNDVQRLVTNLFKATTPKGAQSQDPFWDTAASMLLLALIFYLRYEAPKDEQNFPMVMEMLRAGDVREDNDEYQSPLDELFDRLEMRSPNHIALKYYRDYHSGSAKTLKSIQITLAARLEKFNLESLSSLTITDELELGTLGEKKVALFALVPDNDSSFNFLISILYTQLFQQLFYTADHKYGGSLPVHVHFVMESMH